MMLKKARSLLRLSDQNGSALRLEYQNLLKAPRVQASLKRLPIPALAACKKVVLKAIADTPNEETLATDARLTRPRGLRPDCERELLVIHVTRPG